MSSDEVLPDITKMCEIELPGGAQGAKPTTTGAHSHSHSHDHDHDHEAEETGSATVSPTQSAAPSETPDSGAGRFVAGLGAAIPLAVAALL